MYYQPSENSPLEPRVRVMDLPGVREPDKLTIWFMERMGFVGLYTPFDRIYILPKMGKSKSWPVILAHEQAHALQRRRDGWFYFWPKILFDYFWHGYENSPYEVEARAASVDYHHSLWLIQVDT